MNKYPRSNNILELNRAFFDIYKKISNLKSRDLQFTFGEGVPDITTCCNSLYLDTLTGDLYEWNPTTGSWVLIYTFAGGTGTPNLQQVLDVGNVAGNQFVELDGDFSNYLAVTTNGLSAISFGVDSTVPYISMSNQTGGGSSTILNNLPTGATFIEMPASSGTLALLSDIVSGGPTTINTQVDVDYTLQLSDGDNNTLVNMDSAVDHLITLDNSTGFPIGTVILVSRKGTGEVNIDMQGGGVLLSANSATNLTYQNSGGTLLKLNATEWYFWGDIGTPATVGGSSIPAVTYQTSNYTINATTDYTVVCTTASFQVTLPPSIVEGQIFNIKNLGSGQTITLVPDGIDTIDGAASQTINYPENLQVQNIDGGWIIL